MDEGTALAQRCGIVCAIINGDAVLSEMDYSESINFLSHGSYRCRDESSHRLYRIPVMGLEQIGRLRLGQFQFLNLEPAISLSIPSCNPVSSDGTAHQQSHISRINLDLGQPLLLLPPLPPPLFKLLHIFTLCTRLHLGPR